ncbi:MULTISPECIES: PIN domain-containing protein [unclassified Roseovarius]|uniref:PIN domain-containing protein n=1 Tax=unclassified Roseovarius TaxID=2614913 RepID=UPI002740298A|nr:MULTISPECIES: PIN domain-containing protein [unclassified Roseovarius]
MARRLFLDANIYLSFYLTGKDDLDELAKVAKLISDEEIVLFSNDQLKREVYRNREAKIASGYDVLKSKNFGREFPKYCNDYEETEEIRRLLKLVGKEHAKLMERVAEGIKNRSLNADIFIDGLFSIATELGFEPDTIAKAKDRVAFGDPPGKRNSLGDAIHWQILLEHSGDGDLDIVSLDGDFTSPLSTSSISEFLFDEWKSKKHYGQVELFSSLSDYTKARFPEIRLSDEFKKDELVTKLVKSPNFSTTHDTIAKLNEFDHFTKGQIRMIFSALTNNQQVNWICTDSDVLEFYKQFQMTAGHLDCSTLQKAESELGLEADYFIPF